MKVKKYNISVPEKYTSQGQEKTFWNNVGTITVFIKENGEQSLQVKIPAIGLNAPAFIAEENRQQKTQQSDIETEVHSVDVTDDNIDTEDLPF